MNRTAVVLLLSLVLGACAWAPSQDERGEFKYLSKCNPRHDGWGWCEVRNRPWGERL